MAPWNSAESWGSVARRQSARSTARDPSRGSATSRRAASDSDTVAASKSTLARERETSSRAALESEAEANSTSKRALGRESETTSRALARQSETTTRSRPLFEAEADAAPSKTTDDILGADANSEPESDAEREERAVGVRGIEGTMTKYDVKSTLEARARDFDHCHDREHGGSGKLAVRIRILSDGDVEDVRVRHSSVRNRALVACYTDVIKTSKFPSPHGGYADVNWSTKVGRSRPQPGDIFQRRGRWDAPSGSSSRSSRRSRR